MGGGSESKKQLGKIMLQQRVVSAEELAEQRAAKRDSSTEAVRRDRSAIQRALEAHGQAHGLPAVDLSERVIPLGLLKLVPVEMARERLALPFALDDETLHMVFAAAPEAELVEELAFLAGKAIAGYVCAPPMLQSVIEHAYLLLSRGEDQFYVGAFVSASQLAALGLPNLPRAPDPMPLEAPEPYERPEPPSAEVSEKAQEPQESPSPIARQQPVPSDPPELDAAFAERTRPSLMPKMDAPSGDARVLLACSDHRLREALRGELSELGLTVLEAVSGTAALDLARERNPRVLVLDADLEAMHGFEVWRRLRATAHFAETAAVLITSEPRQWRIREDLRQAFGVAHCFCRPVDPKRLARTVRLLLDDPTAPPELPPLSPQAEATWTAAMQAFQGGDLDGAIEALEGGVAQDPEAFELRYHLGLLYGRRESAFAAIAALEQAVALQPEHFSALKNLAVVYQRAGFRNASVDVWQQAMAAAPDDETRATIREHMLSLL